MLFIASKGWRRPAHDDGHLRQWWIYIQTASLWVFANLKALRSAWGVPSTAMMLGGQLKSKPKKRSRGFIGGALEQARHANDRVVMLCEDVPSEGSTRDSGRGSNGSRTRSSSDELGHTQMTYVFQRREGQSISMSSGPTKQSSVRDFRHVGPPPLNRPDADQSTLCIRD